MENVAGTTVVPDAVKRGKRVTMAAFRPKNMKIERGAYLRIEGIGRERFVDLFVADDAAHSRSMVSNMCWIMMSQVSEKHQAAALFASAVGAYVPKILHSMVPCLEERSVKINVIDVPDMAEDLGYATNVHKNYSFKEDLMNLGLCFLLPFKHLDDKNFTNFINARKKELGEKIGVLPSEMVRYRFPVDLKRSLMIQGVISTTVKQEILKYLMWASGETGELKSMARYVCSILAWNEMNLLVFINNVFINSESPVMNHPAIQDEVVNYRRAMIHILRSPCPQYFRHFCNGAEEQMISRQNFKVLGSVAKELLRRKQKGKSIENFAGRVEKGSELVESLIKIHEDFCQNHEISGTARNIKFKFDEGHHEEILEEDDEEE